MRDIRQFPRILVRLRTDKPQTMRRTTTSSKCESIRPTLPLSRTRMTENFIVDVVIHDYTSQVHRVGLTVFLNGFIEPLAIVHLFGLHFLLTSSISKRRCRLLNLSSNVARIMPALLGGHLYTRLWRRNAGLRHITKTGENDRVARLLLEQQLAQSPCHFSDTTP